MIPPRLRTFLLAIVVIIGYENVVAEDLGGLMPDAIPEYGQIVVDEHGIAFSIYEREFDHPAQTVWNEITDPSSRLEVFSSADLRQGGEVSIRFSDELVETATITILHEPRLLEYVNVETHGYPAKYFTDRLTITDNGEGSTVVFSTPLGTMGPLQLRIAVGWHVWIDNWQLQLADPGLTRTQLDASQPYREKQILEPYTQQLRDMYPGWSAE